jgi:Patatin-like phospholipase
MFYRDLCDIWIRSVDIYRKEYEKCSFRFHDGQPCTSRPWKLHQQHTSAKGQFQPGSFLHKREWNSARKNEWIANLRRNFLEHYYKVFLAKGCAGLPNSLEDRLATERKLSRNAHAEMWKNIKSNKTCLSCLQAVPDHVLGCGHSYCPRCVQELGVPSSASECAWEIHCWLCWDEKGTQIHQIQLKPRCAGVRILTLDGGGIRAISELSVLQALHNALGLENFLIRDMFDLIVGTSTGTVLHIRFCLLYLMILI